MATRNGQSPWRGKSNDLNQPARVFPAIFSLSIISKSLASLAGSDNHCVLVFKGLSGSRYFTTEAGLPTAMALAGTSFNTIEPAPIIALSPIVTPLLIMALSPIQTLRPICTASVLPIGKLRSSKSCQSESVIQASWAIIQPSPIVTAVADIIRVPGQSRLHRPISIFPESLSFDQIVNLTFLSEVAMT